MSKFAQERLEEMDTQLTQYDELAIRHRAAFAAFRSIFVDKNPQPQPTPVEADSLFVPIALVVMIIASVFVSGSRTIVEFGGGFVGVMAFLMLEGAIVAYAFYRTRRNFTEERLETVRKMANFGLGLAFTVAVAANIHSVLKEKGVQVAEGINTAILIMVGVSAPTLAFISGDIMAVESKANGVKSRKAKLEDEENLRQWNEALNAAWAREKGRWGVKVEVENPTFSNGIPLESNGMLPAKSSLGHKKVPDASKRVAEYFAQNPEAINGNPLEIASQLQVGKSTVYNYLKAFKSDQK